MHNVRHPILRLDMRWLNAVLGSVDAHCEDRTNHQIHSVDEIRSSFKAETGRSCTDHFVVGKD
jgi:hypothetical protein